MNRLLGPIRQTAYVVRDIEAEMRHWVEALGVGPWFYVERAAMTDFICRSQRAEPNVSIALANSGSHQIELIQQRDASPTLYREFTDAGRYGLHHIAYWTLDFDPRLADLAAHGFEVVMSGAIGANGRFAYAMRKEDPDTIIELSEIKGRKGKTFEMIAEAARTWDGTNPIRRF